MNTNTHLEIHFHNENKATAFIKSNVKGGEKDFCEILIFCYLALRQMHNLKSNRVSMSLAEILSTTSGGGSYSDYWQMMSKLKNETDIPYYVPFIAALGVDINKLVGLIPALGIYRAVNKLSDEQLAKQICPTIAQIKKHSGRNGKKRFIADMVVREKKTVNFALQTKGFGFLGKGANYYAPMSVILILKYLYSSHDDWTPENSRFKTMLTQAANLCGQAFLQGKVSTVSQVKLPLNITNQVFSA